MRTLLTKSSVFARLVIAVIVVACSSTDRATAPRLRPAFAISDAVHEGGTPGFFFLPPMLAQPTFSGTFDADVTTLNPAIAICDVTNGPDTNCGLPGGTPAVVVFTTTSIPAITVDLFTPQYQVNWDTKGVGFTAGHTYRLHVTAGATGSRRELGFADVLLTTTPGQAKQLVTGDLIVLPDGRTLPIHVRIETGIPGSLAVSAASPSIMTGGSDLIMATVQDLHGAPLAGAMVAWSVTTTPASGVADAAQPLNPPSAQTGTAGTTVTTFNAGGTAGTAVVTATNAGLSATVSVAVMMTALPTVTDVVVLSTSPNNGTVPYNTGTVTVLITGTEFATVTCPTGVTLDDLDGVGATVGTRAVSCAVDSDMQITATFPAGIRTNGTAGWDVQVTNLAGSNATSDVKLVPVAGLVISEVYTGSSGKPDHEFLEVYNRTALPIDVTSTEVGLRVHIRASTGADVNKVLTFVTAGILPAHGFLLIASSASVSLDAWFAKRDIIYGSSSANLFSNGGVYISLSATANAKVIDNVGWGSQPAGGFEGTALADIGLDQSVERKPAGGGGHATDTDNNANDFLAPSSTITPRGTVDTPEP